MIKNATFFKTPQSQVNKSQTQKNLKKKQFF